MASKGYKKRRRERASDVLVMIRDFNHSAEILVDAKPSQNVSNFWKRVDDNIAGGEKTAAKERLRFGGISKPWRR